MSAEWAPLLILALTAACVVAAVALARVWAAMRRDARADREAEAARRAVVPRTGLAGGRGRPAPRRGRHEGPPGAPR